MMKAVAFSRLREVEIIEIPKPILQNKTDVLLKIGSVGICGSDMHYYKSGRIGNQIISYPSIAGHEGSGKVEAVGSQVSKVKPDDSVILEPHVECGQCSQCLAGRYNTCLNGQFVGCPGQLQGCMAEFLVMPESCCFPIDRNIDSDMAALVEPLSVGLYATQFLQNTKSKDIAILGSGPIGLCVQLALKNHQTDSLFMTDKITTRLSMAEKQGAIWTGNPETSDVIGEIADRKPDRLDVVFECCGEQEALDQAVELLKPGGKIVIVGIPESDRISFDISELRRKEITVQNVHRQNGCMQEAVHWVEEDKFNISQLITHRFPLEKAQEAFILNNGTREGMIKTIIQINSD